VRVTRPFALPCESQGVQMQTDVPMEVSGPMTISPSLHSICIASASAVPAASF
jgi:hypothetical protein